MPLRTPALLTVTVTKPVPDSIRPALDLPDGAGLGSVLRLSPSGARALVLRGLARYGSAAEDALKDTTPEPPPPSGGGGGGEVAYRHTQSTPAGTWVIPHALNRRPVVELIVGGELVYSDVTYPSLTQVTVMWPEPTSGEARLI